VNWVPAWMVEKGSAEGTFSLFSGGKTRKGRVRNMYSDKEVRRAQKFFIHETADALQGHPAVWGWDLGNRPSSLVRPPSADSARAWLEEMATELKRRDSTLPITLGLDQVDLEEARVPGPREIAPYCDILSIHAFPIHAAWAEGPLDTRFSLFLCLLTQWLGGREVLLEGAGVPTRPPLRFLSEPDRKKLGGLPLAGEDEMENFYLRTLDLLKSHGVIGAMAWCFSDYDPSLWDRPPLDDQVQERFYGLFRWDETPKPAAKLIQDYPRQTNPGKVSQDWIDIRSEEYYGRPKFHLPRLYNRFKEHFF
jgi:endo-1,4-beta-mannosidase